MLLGFSTLFAIRRGLSYALKRLQRGELRGARVCEVVDEGATRVDGRSARRVREVLDTLGLKLTVHAPFLDVNIASLSPSMRRASLRHLERSLQWTAKLEGETWVVHGGAFPHPKVRGEAFDRMVSSLRRLVRVAEDLGVRVALENSAYGDFQLLASASEALRAVEAVGSDHLGLCLDLGHANIARQLDEFLSSEALARVVHVHLHDNDGRRDLHLPPGRGLINWPRALGRLREGFHGPAVIEVERLVGDGGLSYVLRLAS
ncbi:hypothetical protein B6U99_06565 [Candidatus Geothermarchaeota archaeon ex4572_27]|nr:MAG: hypothetical protein B6U99_06565 [Candidatus Geothermarchaeota archaeon ex4572_27]